MCVCVVVRLDNEHTCPEYLSLPAVRDATLSHNFRRAHVWRAHTHMHACGGGQQPSAAAKFEWVDMMSTCDQTKDTHTYTHTNTPNDIATREKTHYNRIALMLVNVCGGDVDDGRGANACPFSAAAARRHAG